MLNVIRHYCTHLAQHVRHQNNTRLCTNAGSIAEDPFNCEVISHEEGAVQQLILMALSDNEVVVEQACKTIGKCFLTVKQ